METAQVAREIVSSPARDEIVVARILELAGFGGRTSGEIMGLVSGAAIGSLMFGSMSTQVRELADGLRGGSSSGLIADIALGDADAVNAGLACGGVAKVALIRPDAVFWEALSAIAARSVVAVATDISEPQTRVLGYCTPASSAVLLSSPGLTGPFTVELASELKRRAELRRAESWVGQLAGREVHIETYSPTSRCVVVGASELANAIVAQFELLGMSAWITDNLDGAIRATADFGSNDAVVLLSHDHEIGVPLFSELIKIPGVYLGALGSRHTQQVRRDALVALGHSDDDLKVVYGPVGLDLGAKTPPETAVAIAAEFLAHRSNRAGDNLRETHGSING